MYYIVTMRNILIQIQGVHAAIAAGVVSYGTGIALIHALTDLLVSPARGNRETINRGATR
jgi:hypothetical protein